MLTLIKNDSNKPIEARARHSRLAAALSVMWEAEMVSLRTLEAFNKRSRKPWLYYGCEATITTPEGRKLKLDLEWP